MAGTAPKKKQNVKALLAGAQRAVRTVKVCTRADLVDEYETLEAQLKATQGETDTLGGPDTADLEAAMAALRERMDETSLEFRIRGLPQREYTALIAQNPPREGNKVDAVMGFNQDEVIEQLIRRGTEEPDLDEEDWQRLLGEVLNRATYAQLTNAAWSVNTQDVSAPF